MSVDHGPAGTAVSSAEMERVVEILVGAFFDDPVWAWAFPDPAARKDQHRRLWRLYVEGAARYPNVWLNADSTATAVWIPPGGTDLAKDQSAQVEPLLLELLGPSGARRAIAMGEAFEQAHPHEVEHYYLTLLGTDPAYRGQGRGLGLLAQNLQQVDAENMPAYLEASNPANVALYARQGFRTHSVIALPDGGPDVNTMWREPRVL